MNFDLRETDTMPAPTDDTAADDRSMARPPLFAAPYDQLDDAALLAHLRAPRRAWFAPVLDADETRPERIESIMTGRFEFNGEAHALPAPIDWLKNPSADVEWHILLHKFYYAPGLGLAWQRGRDARHVRRWAELIDGWMAATPLDFIAVDVTGRRVQNWIYSLHYFVFDSADAPVEAGFVRRMLASLAAQVELLCARLTPKRNHRTLELTAIFLAGVALPEFARAAHWRAFALRELVANLQADLLPDGVHCELSTDYHHLVVKNFLNVRRLAARNGIEVPAAMDEPLQRALEFSAHVHRPDGIVPSLSDGDARSFLDLLAEGAHLYDRDDLRYVASAGREGRAPARRVAHFAASGYTVLRSSWGGPQAPGGERFGDAHYAVLDSGPLGEGNHGHLDCLSFELAAHGRALVVDPGRYTYSEAGDVNWRVQFRGTAAHNTVSVDGRQQTRYEPKAVKPGTRHASGTVRHRIAGPAPEARLLEMAVHGELDLLHAEARSHEYDALHRRRLLRVALPGGGGYWIVSDRLSAATPHQYAQRFQLSPAAQGALRLHERAGHIELTSPGLTLVQARRVGASLTVEPAWVSMRYGEKHAAPRVCTQASGPNACFDTLLLPWRGAAHTAHLRELALQGGTTRDAALALHLAVVTPAGQVDDLWLHAAQPGQWHVEFGEGRIDFAGTWLHLRSQGHGQPLRAHADAGARLHWNGGPFELARVAP